MNRDRSDLDFARQIASKSSRRLRTGEPLISMMSGGLSLAFVIVEVAALIGRGPDSLPGLVKRGTMVLRPADPEHHYPGRFAPGWWFVPEAGFWVLILVGLSLATLGILLSRRRGLPITSSVAFAIQSLILATSYYLALTDG